MALTWSISEYVTRAARDCSLAPPSAWTSSTTGNEAKFLSFLKETTDELLDRHDWNQCTSDNNIAGIDDTSYDLPSDFLRLCPYPDSVFETSPNKHTIVAMPRHGEWTRTQAWNATNNRAYYRLYGSTIEFSDALPTGGIVVIAYVSKNWATNLAGGAPSAAWVLETDLSLLPGKLLQYGLVWRWRKHKGLSWAAEKAEYEGLLARAIGDDAPMRVISTGGYSERQGHFMSVPVPDVLPT